MISRFIAALTALMTLLLAVPTAPAERAFLPPEGYNEHDYMAVVSFLEQPSSIEGVKNGSVLNQYYDPSDPATFAGDPNAGESAAWSFTWAKTEYGEYRLFSVELRAKPELSGELALSGCEALESAALWGLAGVSALELSGCTALGTLYCCSCGIEELSAINCPALWYAEVSDCACLKTIDFSGSALACGRAEAEGSGYIGFSAGMLTAAPLDGAEFAGWYLDGVCVSTEPQLDPSPYIGGPLTAVFSSASVCGDMDGDGQLSFTDVSLLYLALIGSGELSPNGDYNSDGSIDFADVARLCLALLQ